MCTPRPQEQKLSRNISLSPYRWKEGRARLPLGRETSPGFLSDDFPEEQSDITNCRLGRRFAFWKKNVRRDPSGVLYFEFNHIAVLYRIFFALDTKPSQFTRLSPRSGFQQFFPIYHLRSDKFFFKIPLDV